MLVVIRVDGLASRSYEAFADEARLGDLLLLAGELGA